MRILESNPADNSVKVLLEIDEDLWHLYNVVEVGDVITASTTRRDEKATDKLRAERAEKKRMTLGVQIEKMEFSEDDLRLRLLGTIVDGPQDVGQHHTLILETGDNLRIGKRSWRDSHMSRLRRAVEESGKPRILFVSLDQDEATIAILRQLGPKEIAEIRSQRSGKQYEEKKKADTYHDEIAEKLEALLKESMPLVLLGPGFEKEILAEHLKGRGMRSFVYHTGQSGMTGVNEFIKTGMGADVLKDSSVRMEMEEMERLMREIGKDGLATYGPKEVESAAEAGCVECLLVLDSLIRERDMDALLRTVESQQGRIIVVSSQHDAGQELSALGGMGAILRYRL